MLALAQRAEARSGYEGDADATDAMVADERIHGEVVSALAARGRQRLSGTFRAAVFGVNDGLVSNLALVLGVSAAGLPQHVVLLTGVAGLLAGALSMGAGEYVSVRSQRELLDATTPRANHSRPVGDCPQMRGACGETNAVSGRSVLPGAADVDQVVAVGAIAVQEHDDVFCFAGLRLQPRSIEFTGHALLRWFFGLVFLICGQVFLVASATGAPSRRFTT